MSYGPTEFEATQFQEISEQILGDRIRGILGPDATPQSVEGRLHSYHFPDGEFIVHLDGKPILQVKGPCLYNGMACIWRTANFRTA